MWERERERERFESGDRERERFLRAGTEREHFESGKESESGGRAGAFF